MWSGNNSGNPYSLRIYVRNLRRKLGDATATPRRIFSERGVKCRMTDPEKE